MHIPTEKLRIKLSMFYGGGCPVAILIVPQYEGMFLMATHLDVHTFVYVYMHVGEGAPRIETKSAFPKSSFNETTTPLAKKHWQLSGEHWANVTGQEAMHGLFPSMD